MEIKQLNSKQKNLFKALLLINTFVIIGLGMYYFIFKIIQKEPNSFFDTYVFLPLFLILLGTETMIMSLVSYNSSFKSNSSQDNAMFKLGMIIIIIGILTIFVIIGMNKLRG